MGPPSREMKLQRKFSIGLLRASIFNFYNRMNRVYIKTYGCQMNERDSAAVEALLRARGYIFVDSETDADVILINTCSVRDQAEQKALGKMGRMQKLKMKNPKLILGIMGCMAQNRGVSLLDRLPELDLVVGTQKIHRVPEHLDALQKTREGLGPKGKTLEETVIDIAEEENSQNAINVHPNAGEITSFVSIQQGCDMHCAFCIVPKTRGDERSRPMGEILEEIRELAEGGTKEVVLLGQIVTSYGRKMSAAADAPGKEHRNQGLITMQPTRGCNIVNGDEGQKPDAHSSGSHASSFAKQDQGLRATPEFGLSQAGYGVQPQNNLPRPQAGGGPFVQLLEAIETIEGIERVRFTSPHPRGFKDDLIECFGRLKKLCESVHLPLQSGSDKILRAMNRPYSSARYLQIVDALRARVPDIYLSTDIIVGFPGETDEDFEKTREIFARVGYDMAFIFKYSKRSGTPAAELGDQITEEIKEKRNQALLEILHASSLKRSESLLGMTQEVLVEGWAKRGGKLMGRNRGGRKILFKGGEILLGEMVQVKIEKATVTTLEGEVIK